VVDLTIVKEGKPIYQLSKGLLNVKTLTIPLPADLSGAATLYTLIFPFAIRVIGLGLTNGGQAPSNAVDITLTLTDGSSPISVTMLGSGAVPKQDAEDQIFLKNTELDIDNAAGTLNTTEQAIFEIHYIPLLPTVR